MCFRSYWDRSRAAAKVEIASGAYALHYDLKARLHDRFPITYDWTFGFGGTYISRGVVFLVYSSLLNSVEIRATHIISLGNMLISLF
jgi:hypothetical protein